MASTKCATIGAGTQLNLLSQHAARALMEQDVQPTAVAGLSVGAFAAAVVAGVLALADGVELLRLRATMMVGL